MLKNFAVFFFR